MCGWLSKGQGCLQQGNNLAVKRIQDVYGMDYGDWSGVVPHGITIQFVPVFSSCNVPEGLAGSGNPWYLEAGLFQESLTSSAPGNGSFHLVEPLI